MHATYVGTISVPTPTEPTIHLLALGGRQETETAPPEFLLTGHSLRPSRSCSGASNTRLLGASAMQPYQWKMILHFDPTMGIAPPSTVDIMHLVLRATGGLWPVEQAQEGDTASCMALAQPTSFCRSVLLVSDEASSPLTFWISAACLACRAAMASSLSVFMSSSWA